MAFLLVTSAFIVTGVVAAVLYTLLRPRPPAGLSDENIRVEACRGNWLVAIRWYRELHGVGLKQAKEAVDKLPHRP
jgi:ribosomal protein L7/L12